jgi:hypothetical protein
MENDNTATPQNGSTNDIAQQLPSLLTAFASNSSYINENYVQYFQNELSKAPSHTEMMNTTDRMKTYIEDSLCSITEHIAQISNQYSIYLQQQSDELNIINMRVQSINYALQSGHQLVGKQHKDVIRQQSTSNNE